MNMSAMLFCVETLYKFILLFVHMINDMVVADVDKFSPFRRSLNSGD